MSYYSTCPICGAHLDPGEVCDCDNEFKGIRIAKIEYKKYE